MDHVTAEPTPNLPSQLIAGAHNVAEDAAAAVAGIETLQARRSDSLDFLEDLAVWELDRMLKVAALVGYARGLANGQALGTDATGDSERLNTRDAVLSLLVEQMPEDEAAACRLRDLVKL